MRENVLAAAERRVDNKIAELQALQVGIQKLLGQRDVEEQKQIDSLVKTYSAMKPRDAARIFDTLDDEIRVTVAQKMKADVLAPVLAAMEAEEAQKLTRKLADRLKVTPPVLTPPPAPAAPAPDGSATPAPAQTAAVSPAETPKPGG
jgi:flagellar motility protein MotE (MotC chaperone)